VKTTIETKNLHKTYRGGIKALRGVDIAVPAGCCFGLLGPNGAGKSTLVKVLLSIVRPTLGAAWLRGIDISDPKARRSLGYLPEGARYPHYLTASGVCTYFGGLAGLKGPELKKQVKEKLELVGMAEWAKTKVTKFSKGMAQRVGVAQAMLGDPELVFLDEPTDGVDPMAREGLRNTIKAATEGGATVFINSHLLSDIELLCDRVAILNQGEVVVQGTVAEVTAGVTGERLRVRFRTGEIPADLWSELSERGAAREPDSHFIIDLEEEEEITELIDQLRDREVAIFAVSPERMRLEEAFLELIRAEGGTTAVPRLTT
jgi:ABC-2 type transport system ATP-binding protein